MYYALRQYEVGGKKPIHLSRGLPKNPETATHGSHSFNNSHQIVTEEYPFLARICVQTDFNCQKTFLPNGSRNQDTHLKGIFCPVPVKEDCCCRLPFLTVGNLGYFMSHPCEKSAKISGGAKRYYKDTHTPYSVLLYTYNNSFTYTTLQYIYLIASVTI